MKDKIMIRASELQIFIVPANKPEETKKVTLPKKVKKKKTKFKWRID